MERSGQQRQSQEARRLKSCAKWSQSQDQLVTAAISTPDPEFPSVHATLISSTTEEPPEPSPASVGHAKV